MIRNRLYYEIKPLVPRSVRDTLRRWHARRIRFQNQATWPILRAAAHRPSHWRGWPEGKQFAVVLTHDVESECGLDRIAPLVDLEESFGFRSSFYFVPEGSYRVSRGMREDLRDRGFEVGVHDLHHDGKLYVSHAEFSRRAAKINKYIHEWGAFGFRSAFMLNNLQWLLELDVKYDASTFDTDPFEPQPYGVGTIFPFWVPGADGHPGYVELPYTLVQDSTLFLFLGESDTRIWTQKLDWVAANGGMVLLNSHPDYFDFVNQATDKQYPSARYADFLAYLREHYEGRFWHALPHEVADWCRELRANAGKTPEGRQADQSVVTESIDVHPRLAGKRVAVVLYSQYPIDARPRRAAEALVAAGAHVEVLCLKDEESNPDSETINGVEIHRTSLMQRRGGMMVYLIQYLRFFLIAFWYLARRSVLLRYSLVHVHNMPDFLVFSALVPRLMGARLILDLHDPMPELGQVIFKLPSSHWIVRLLQRIERWSIGVVDLAVTPNIAFQRIFEARGCPRGKVQLIMNSPEADIFRRGVDPWEDDEIFGGPGTFRVLHHGSIVHRHGLDIAVDAIALVSQHIPNVHLTICGARTPYLDRVLNEAREKGIEQLVTYVGPRPHRDIARFVASCDVGIIPNRRSPFTELNMPTRIFEYLAMDKPVIAPATPGIHDYFDDSNLLFFEPNSAEDLAARIIWVHQHPQEVQQFVARGREVYNQHTWEQERKRLIEMAANLL